MTSHSGEIRSALEGLYERDARHLSRYCFTVNGQAPRLDSSSNVDPGTTLAYHVTSAHGDREIERDPLGYPMLEEDRQIVIRVARTVGGGLHEEIELANHGLDEADLRLGWRLEADFADLMEARAGQRQQSAEVQATWEAAPSGGRLRFDYLHPKLAYGTEVEVTLDDLGTVSLVEPFDYADGELRCSIRLGPQQTARLCLVVIPISDSKRHPTIQACGKAPEDARRHLPTIEATRIETPNPVVRATWERALTDLRALALNEGEDSTERLVPGAGIPLYPAIFGRDAFTTSAQAMLATPELACGALRLLTRYIGDHDDDFYDEQPGRLPQQIRHGPLARLGLTTWAHDYGDYAAPCAYLVLLGGYHIITNDRETVGSMLEPARRVLNWLERRGDIDGDGFLDYRTRSPKGQKHQGWKDSPNAVVDHLGRQVDPPIAPCEVQGYWYAALGLMAEVFLAFGHTGEAFQLARRARQLKHQFNQRFWMPDQRFFAMGLGPDKQQIRAITSNVGHCLATGIIDQDYADDVRKRLLAPDMFSGWGIRTLSSQNPAYNPFSYHLGTVWPVENATIAFGLKRYGFGEAAAQVARGIFDAAALFENHRLPEAFGGHPRDARHPHPGVYPDACMPQAWSASAVFWLLQAMLGIWSYAPLRLLVLDPELPDWLPELTLRDLRVAGARVSLQFKRDQSGKTDYRVLERTGKLRIVRQPPPEAIDTSMVERSGLLVRSLMRGMMGR